MRSPYVPDKARDKEAAYSSLSCTRDTSRLQFSPLTTSSSIASAEEDGASAARTLDIPSPLWSIVIRQGVFGDFGRNCRPVMSPWQER